MPVRIIRAGGGARGPPGSSAATPTATFFEAYSTTTQTIVNNAPPAPILFDVQRAGDNFVPNPTPTSIVKIPNTATYSLMYSVQCRSNNPGLVDLFLIVNGTRVANSSSRSTLKNNEEIVLTCSYILPFVAGDTLQVAAYAAGMDVSILSVPDNPLTQVPAAPGIIFNIFKIR